MPGKITFNIDMQDFRADVQRMGAAAEGAMIKAVMAGGQVIEGYAKINANEVFSSHATNTLAGSIQTVLAKASTTTAEVHVGPTVVYGRIHEFGGVIKPVFAKVLHFFTYDGQEVFAKAVHMPARPYLRPAVDDHRREIYEAVIFQIKKALGI